MYVMEYFLYHLRPYGIDSELRFQNDISEHDKQDNLIATTTENSLASKETNEQHTSGDISAKNDTQNRRDRRNNSIEEKHIPQNKRR